VVEITRRSKKGKGMKTATKQFIILFTITSTIIFGAIGAHFLFADRLPAGHKACKSSCDLARYAIDNPNWFGYRCEEDTKGIPHLAFCVKRESKE